MIARAIVVWFAILIGAIVNGFVRQTWLIPLMGDAPAHIVSTLTLSAIVLLIAWDRIRWMRPATHQAAIGLGVLWLVMTLAFEFLAGHFLFGQPWERLLADYDLANGRIWTLVLIVTAAAPYLTARARGLLISPSITARSRSRI